MDIELECVSEPTPEVRQLLGELDEALSGPYSADQRHALSVDQLFQPNIRFFLARLDGVAVACGGVAFLDGYGEVKRMYSRPSVRGRGVAKGLLRRIEAETRDVGLSLLRIETGIYQEEALRFYEGAGFRRCGPFGPYAALPPHAIETSLFYEKTV
jgi:GNAT superfamily N-acetyltransferase